MAFGAAKTCVSNNRAPMSASRIRLDSSWHTLVRLNSSPSEVRLRAVCGEFRLRLYGTRLGSRNVKSLRDGYNAPSRRSARPHCGEPRSGECVRHTTMGCVETYLAVIVRQSHTLHDPPNRRYGAHDRRGKRGLSESLNGLDKTCRAGTACQ